MSWHFSLGLAVDYSRAVCSSGAPYAQWKSTAMRDPSFNLGNTIDLFRVSPSGMTCEPSTDDLGEATVTWFRADFLAKPTPPQLEDAQLRQSYGHTCAASSMRLHQDSSSRRTFRLPRSTGRLTTSMRWVTKPTALPFRRRTWVATTFANVIGYVHTPTTKANYAAESMQKWASSRNFVAAFGKPHPEHHEYLMGWPTGWSALRPLEMDKFLSWRQRHGVL